MALTRFIVLGDDDTTSGKRAVYVQMKKVPEVKRFLHCGDLPYSKSGTAWVNQHKEYFTEQEKEEKWRVSKGNHDCSSSESNQTQKDLEAYFKRYKGTVEGRGNLWIEAEQVDNVYIINMDSEDLDVEFKRKQFDFVKAELEKAKQLRAEGKIDWILVMFHKPFFTLKSSHSPYTSVRFLYREIFRDAQVDFVCHGHNHNTQLWYPMIPSDSSANGEGTQLFSFASDGKTFDFVKDHGQLFLIQGNGGHEHNSISDSGSGVKNVMHYRDSGKFGFTQLDIDGKKVNVKSIDSDGKVHFEYNVTREAGDIPPPVDEIKASISPTNPSGVKDETISLSGSNSKFADKYSWSVSPPEQLEIVGDSSDKVDVQIKILGDSPNGQVTLTVTNEDGTKSDTTTANITVTPPPPPEIEAYDLFLKDKQTDQVIKIISKTIEREEDKKADYSILIDELPVGDTQKEISQFKVDVTNDEIPPPPPPPPPTQTEKKLTPTSVIASRQDAGKEANKVADGNFETRWSANGDNQWIEFTFDKPYQITKVGLTGYWYDKTYFFEIAGKRFENKAGRPQNQLIDYDLKDLNINSNKVRIICHGNSGSTYNSYREIAFYGLDSGDIPPPPPPPPPPTTGDTDIFGIQKIYQTNPNGAPEFYLGVDDWQSRIRHNGTVSGTGKETTIKVTSDEARIWVHTDTAKQAIIELNHQKYSQNQFMLNNKDFKNCEMTAKVKLNKIGGSGNPAFKWGLRGGELARDAPQGCQGTRYRTHIEYTGPTLIRKDTRSHGSNREFNRTGGKNVGSLLNKEVIIKLVTYNIPNTTNQVKIEVYFDVTGTGKNFEKIQETIDNGGWGTGATDCGGTSGQVIVWGSPMALFRWDGATDVDFKYASVREILPEGISPPPPPPPPEGEAVAKLELPSSAQPNQTGIKADASQSVADTVEITETTSEGITLRDVAGQKWVKEFDIPDKNNFSIGIQAKAVKGTKQSIVQKAIQVSTIPPPPPTGDVLWDSNIHGKWNDGNKRTIKGTWGDQSPDGKGLFTAASGSPRLIVDGDGIAHLEADSGHGRIYIKAINYNSRLEFDAMFEDTNIDNISIKTRNRHGEGGACENRVGGPGMSITPGGLIKAKWEICHNNHEHGNSSTVAAVGTKKWFRIAYSVFDSTDKKSITQLVEIDRKDGQGFKVSHINKVTNPRASYLNEALFMKESYFWLRINNSKTGRVAFKDVRFTKIDSANMSMLSSKVSAAKMNTLKSIPNEDADDDPDDDSKFFNK